MKLFITNRSIFENTIENENELKPNGLNPYLIHKKAFNELHTSIIAKNAIPLQIAVTYNDDLNDIIFFDFQNKKGDVYFYEFLTNLK